MIEFKEDAKWAALQREANKDRQFSGVTLGENKYGITAQSMISLAAPLEKCAHLKELASERRGGQVSF
jgi:hypothetical protein